MSEPITLDEAARYIGVSKATLRRAAKLKTLKASKPGHDWITTRADAQAWKDNPIHHKPGVKPKS